MEEIEQVYGDDVNLDSAKEAMLEDWQLAYLNYMDNFEERLKTDLTGTDTGTYILENRYDSYKPDNVLLYDIDDNGVAELFLFNSSQLDRDYVGCFIYTYDGSSMKYVGFANVCGRTVCAEAADWTVPVKNRFRRFGGV